MAMSLRKKIEQVLDGFEEMSEAMLDKWNKQGDMYAQGYSDGLDQAIVEIEEILKDGDEEDEILPHWKKIRNIAVQITEMYVPNELEDIKRSIAMIEAACFEKKE